MALSGTPTAVLSGLWQLVKAKAAEAAVYLVAALASKADELLPPEALRRQLLYVVGVTAALIVLCCCCGRAAPSRRTMAVPGRGGARIRRDVFEGNPRDYFRGLRHRAR
ncbi:hypothetical protein QOZ80_7BG0607760 [Eleusine coracana subsp. coracana]|nr:hypothetical protein QOZ80_7BG0607760 [Eleusine coracana subsp. coracana]